MKLLEEIELNDNILKNRMVMSAMTRSRADENGIPSDFTAEYYSQRASAGLIISEAINISKDATGSPSTPGLYTQEQIDAWKKATKSVHDNGGVIFAQLWHTGRVAHSVERNGNLPVAPSAIAIKEQQHFTSQGLKDYETPRALEIDEITQIIKHYKRAALNAIEAGFDGVELHAANGYLPSQFLAENTNQRSDKYGGSIANNCRFILETMKELIDAIGGEKVGIKISPFSPFNEIAFKNPVETFTYLINELNKMDFAFIEITRKPATLPIPSHYPEDDEISLFGSISKNTVIANSGYNKEDAEIELQKGIAKMISFGALFLANPDLPKRFELNAELNEIDITTVSGGGAKGYTDYSVLRLET